MSIPLIIIGVIVVIIVVMLVIISFGKNNNATQNTKPIQPPNIPVSKPGNTDQSQITLEQLKGMSPSQIEALNISELTLIKNQYLRNFHGIPTFPLLESQLSSAQMNAFLSVITPDGRVY